MAFEHYKNLFSIEERSGNSTQSFLNHSMINNTDRQQLLSPVLNEEIIKAFFDMKSLKAPRADGFQPH